LGEYRAALKLVHRVSLILNIAQCYRQLRQTERALFYYRLYLSDAERLSPGQVPPYADEVQGHIRELSALLRREQQRQQQAEEGASGQLWLADLPRGSWLEVDGTRLGEVPLDQPLTLSGGLHRVRAGRFGFSTWSASLQVRAGGSAVEQVRLERSRLWLIGGVSAAALAAGAEIAAVVLTLEAREQYQGTPEWESRRNGALAGHVLAGTLAAAAVACLVVHWHLGRLPRARPPAAARRPTLALQPLRGGGWVGGSFRF
jgi:hypothetical protein